MTLTLRVSTERQRNKAPQARLGMCISLIPLLGSKKFRLAAGTVVCPPPAVSAGIPAKSTYLGIRNIIRIVFFVAQSSVVSAKKQIIHLSDCRFPCCLPEGSQARASGEREIAPHSLKIVWFRSCVRARVVLEMSS